VRVKSLVSGKISYALAACSAAVLFAVTAFGILPSISPGAGAWRDWSIALLDDRVPLKTAMEALKHAGVAPVWSEINQTVYLTDFVSGSRVPLPDALARLLPDDPRRTPWLDHLVEYFRVEDESGKWNILYFPSQFSSKASNTLRKLCGPMSWRLKADSPARRQSFFWISPACLVLFFIFRSRSSRFYPLVNALPWVPLWFSGNLSAVLAGILGYHALLTLGQEDGLEPGRVLGSFSWNTAARVAPIGASFLAMAFSDMRLMPSILFSLASAIALILFFEDHYLRTESISVHTVFEGKALDVRRAEKERERAFLDRTLAVFLASGMLIIIQGTLAAPAGSMAVLPGTPRVPSPNGIYEPFSCTSERISHLVKGREDPELPDLADAVAHRAYQQAIPFSRVGSRKYGNLEPVMMERYSSEGTAVRENKEVVLNFNDAWVHEALREERKQGIGEVLGDQRGIIRVEKLAAQGSGHEASLALKDVFSYIMLLAPAGLGLFHRKRRIDPTLRVPARSAKLS
jgi:hypothetical protein